jgi:hypothetical protein
MSVTEDTEMIGGVALGVVLVWEGRREFEAVSLGTTFPEATGAVAASHY